MIPKRKHIRVTYSTLNSPDPLLHKYFEEDVVKVKDSFGEHFPMYVDGEWVTADNFFLSVSPVDTTITIGEFQQAGEKDVAAAVEAARSAFLTWRETPWQERNALLSRVADLISERLFMLAAVISIEVGKNRLESIGEVEEAADLIRFCVQSMEKNNGYSKHLDSEDSNTSNHSVLKPYGVWGVISPFNFPCALTCGPVGAALVAGNTVVHKPADDAAYISYLLAECFHDAGIPAGVYNMVTGGDAPGKALVANSHVNGMSFTGSYEVGMSIMRDYAAGGTFVRPLIAEMGGKNVAIVSRNADLETAAFGVVRSAFGATGQKCSSCSRVYVHRDVKSAFMDRLVELTKQLKVGDPTLRDNDVGPLVNDVAYRAYQKYVAEAAADGEILVGGETLDENGYYVAPTVVDKLPFEHHLWKQELFVPLVIVGEFNSQDEAMRMANDVFLGLTAGFFSQDDREVDWFLDNIEAGCVYVNRAAGATTGAWPGYQAFGGWKGSTGTSKSSMSHYYLQQYMREQSQTVVNIG
ncbi:MAG: aldehyde dehydrogenase family protein [Anaerolineales bacterium]|nr:aldehyde dehydrogenase family protein [Anaerolineales bacterium]